MTTKTALVVDDSKSARLVLKRMLEKLNIEVETVETADEALDYLKENQPDVIFMDHMMPGMDGFEAVKRIKENPQTAIIPIMMYTSKSGDVYLSQARALGAIGVIAKTIAAVDLKDSLLKLGIIDEETASTTIELEKPAESETEETETTGEGAVRQVIDKDKALDNYIEDLERLMDDQTVELHRSMWLGIESVSHEIFNRLNNELDQKLQKINSASTENASQHMPLDKKPSHLPVYFMGALFFISIIVNLVLFVKAEKLQKRIDNLVTNQIYALEEKSVTESSTDNQKSSQEFVQWALNKTIEYPYNELALNANRITAIDEVFRHALSANYKGKIILQTHVGRFCLTSDQTGNYSLADNHTPVTECEHIGNFTQPADDVATHQSVSFANYLADTSFLNSKGIFVEVSSISRDIELSKYPERTSETNIGQWNYAAQLNNRISIALERTPIKTGKSVY